MSSSSAIKLSKSSVAYITSVSGLCFSISHWAEYDNCAFCILILFTFASGVLLLTNIAKETSKN